MKNFWKYGVVAVAACALLIACVLEGGDEKPRLTERGFRIYGYAESLNNQAADQIKRVFCFNEYLRQTTDEGRRAVQDRYFYSARIFSDVENVWTLVDAGRRYDFVVEDGIPLGEPGASWVVSQNVSVGVMSSMGTFETQADGHIHCRIAPHSNSDTWVDWLVEVLIVGDDFQLSCSGEGQMFLDRSTVLSCESSLPLVWSNVGSVRGPESGELRIEVSFLKDGTKESAEVGILSVNEFSVTYRGVTERWGYGSY